MTEHAVAAGWIGASLLRKEDARHLYGHGMFIADVQVPGVQDVAFVRSQMAHAHVRRVTKPPDAAAHVFTLADIGPINILEAGPELVAHRHSPYPPLADDRVRYVGQPIAACVHADARPGRGSGRSGRGRTRGACRPSSMCVAAMRAGQSARVRRVARQRLHQHQRGRRQSADARRSADPPAPPVRHESSGHACRSKAAACSPTGTIGSTNWWSICRRRAAM